MAEKKIYTNLGKTPFYIDVDCLHRTYRYFFSSELHSKKFYERVALNRKMVSERLTKRYHFPIENDMLADIYLYVTIENRGFRVIDLQDGREYGWRQAAKLNGAMLTRSM